MRIAVLSDIHSNYYALERVLNHAQQSDADRYWLLGDLIGYGPHPEKCVEWFRNEYRRIDWVMGNHDAMLMGLIARDHLERGPADGKQIRQANAFALKELREVEASSKSKQKTIRINDAIPALLLNKKTLDASPELGEFLQRTFHRGHYGPKKVFSDSIEYWLVHASRLDGRQIGEYIYPWSSHLLKLELQALLLTYQKEPKATNLLGVRLRSLLHAFVPAYQTKPVCQWHGHSHIPYILTLDEPKVDGNWRPICAEPNRPYPLGKVITLANPGSVGQPRNSDKRACYALLDTKQRAVTFYRLAYDYKKTARDMNRLGYSYRLVERLETAKYPSDLPPTPEWAECMKSLTDQGAK